MDDPSLRRNQLSSTTMISVHRNRPPPTDSTMPAIPRQASFDYDLDGDPDCFMINTQPGFTAVALNYAEPPQPARPGMAAAGRDERQGRSPVPQRWREVNAEVTRPQVSGAASMEFRPRSDRGDDKTATAIPAFMCPMIFTNRTISISTRVTGGSGTKWNNGLQHTSLASHGCRFWRYQ